MRPWRYRRQTVGSCLCLGNGGVARARWPRAGTRRRSMLQAVVVVIGWVAVVIAWVAEVCSHHSLEQSRAHPAGRPRSSGEWYAAQQPGRCRKRRDAPLDRGNRAASWIGLPRFCTTHTCLVPRPSCLALSAPRRAEKAADLRPRHAESRRPGARRKPRSSVRGRTPKPPHGPLALPVRPAA